MINVVISSDSRINVDKTAIKESVANVLSKHDVKKNVEVEVLIVGDRKMHQLNKQYRGIDSTTDVLSFGLEDSSAKTGFVAFPDDTLRLGSVVISYPQALRDASIEGISLDEEIHFLVDHGTKHRLGIHHE